MPQFVPQFVSPLVLHVCTGNICRSPIAERLMRAALDALPGGAGVAVASSGTAALVGSAMSPEAAAVLAELGVDPVGFRARDLTADQVAAAALVLTATREHRARVVSLHPPAAVRAFTLREFARLTAGVRPAALPPGAPALRLPALVQAAHQRRGLDPPV
ncbi:MAG: arsenate reductase/protein-tyrosine-phosphatase family protein, partial [Mycobacteriales bacterium]